MIKLEINKENAKIEARGTGLETMTEATVAVQSIYEMLCEHNKLIGAIFCKRIEELCHVNFDESEEQEEEQEEPEEEPTDKSDDEESESDEKGIVEFMELLLNALKEAKNKGDK